MHLRARVPPPPFARRCAARVGNLTPGCGATGDVPRSQRCGSQGVQVEEGGFERIRGLLRGAVGLFGLLQQASCTDRSTDRSSARFAADARRRGGRAWGPGRAGARRAPAAALLPRTRRTLQIPNRISHAQMPARFPGRSPLPSDRFRSRRAPARRESLGSRPRRRAPRSRSRLVAPHTPHFTDLKADPEDEEEDDE